MLRVSLCPPQHVGWGYTRSWEGTKVGQLTPSDQRRDVLECHAQKHGRWGSFLGLSLLKDWLGISQLVVRNCFCITCFFLVCFVVFSSPPNRLYLNSRALSLLCFQFSSPSHCGVSEQPCGAELPAAFKPQQEGNTKREDVLGLCQGNSMACLT